MAWSWEIDKASIVLSFAIFDVLNLIHEKSLIERKLPLNKQNAASFKNLKPTVFVADITHEKYFRRFMISIAS